MFRLFSFVCAVALFCAGVTAQSCADLTVTGDGTPGTDLVFDTTGATADAPFVLFVSPNAGSTSMRIGPLGTLELGIERPMIPLAIGMTDANGDVSFSVTIPPFRIRAVELHAQGTSVVFSIPRMGPPTLEFCTTDVETFSIGT